MTSKHKLLLATSVLALGLVSGNAQAFNSVDWNWTGTFETDLTSSVTITDPQFATAGLTQVEQLQINVGNVFALTNQDYTQVYLPYFNYGKDLGDLGKVTGSATAIGNAISISSDYTTMFHDGQVAFGSFNEGAISGTCGDCTTGSDSFLGTGTGNQMTDAVNAAAMAAALGYINKGYITAISTANYGKNVSVDLNATAIGNLHSVTVNAAPAMSMGDGMSPTVSDAIVVGDVAQFNFNNVTAIASAKGLSIGGLGSSNAAVSSVVATAIGNVSSVVNKAATPSP